MASLAAQHIFSTKGWVALVTGGGTGIGLMCAQGLAANGAKVYITGRRKEVLETSAKIHGSAEALKGSGGCLIPLQMDVNSKESIKRAVDQITSESGYVNVLVNNAGIGSGRAGVAASEGPEKYSAAMFNEDIEDWQRVYMSNNTQIYFVTAAFVPLMMAAAPKSPSKNPGNVINISSQSGITKWSQNSQYAYNCSKAATNHLTRMLAYEFAERSIGIRVNAICPGYWPSELTTGASDEGNKTAWPQDAFEKEMVKVGCNVPVNRPGTEQEMASAVLMFATNAYVYGVVMLLDGGILLRHPATG